MSLKSHNVSLDPKTLQCNKSKFHEPAITKYRDDIKKGRKIERIVVQSERGIMKVLSGNHRTQAHLREKKKKIKAIQLATFLFRTGDPWVDPFE